MGPQSDRGVRCHAGSRLEIERVLSFNCPRRELAVTAWTCFEDRTLSDELWLEYDGSRVTCLTNLPRPDVARHYNVSSLKAELQVMTQSRSWRLNAPLRALFRALR